jgi:asparagine synthase (glutamine-hydrolysing)
VCGIAGFISIKQSYPARELLRRMTDVLTHRGPDGFGYFEDEHAHFGHRRLAIIDVTAGAQPMSNEDKTVWVTYNGEIYNHDHLRESLIRAGHTYETRCDTETILHAYEQFGESCVDQFRGMFSFAIWDQRRRRLMCGRDRLGIKPFYYFWNGRVFVFASEIKAILLHPDVTPDLNPDILAEYLSFGYLSGEETMFRGIRKLPPGCCISLDVNTASPQPEISQYWDVPNPQPQDDRDESSITNECRRRLEEAVQSRLMSDVPLGCFLSGGIDSSAIAAVMKRFSSGKVKTFAVGYHEAAYSELGYARHVADSLGTDHHDVTVTREQFFSALPRVIWHEDEPIVFSSSVPLYFVSKVAAEHVKVVLSGEGSDEMFAGYERYGHYAFNLRWASRYEAAPAALRGAIRWNIAANRFISGDLRRKLLHTFLGRENNYESLQLDNFYAAFSRAEIDEILGGSSDPFEDVLAFWGRRSGSVLARMLYTDQKTYLTELLMRQDQMSMAASIESRVPFLDHPFVQFAMSVPDSLKIHRGERKFILKRAVEDLLPLEIIYRKKMGFSTPLRQWLRDNQAVPMLRQLVRRDGLVRSLLDVTRIENLIERHLRGTEDATDRIWRLLNLQIWGDVFLSGKTEFPDEMAAVAEYA